MAAAFALAIFSGKIIFNFAFGAPPTLVRTKSFHLLSQTARLLESPTGAFMPSGHRRPFWFSFGAKREHLTPGCKRIEIAVPLPR